MAISENDIKYQPSRIEEKWYTHWENRSYFSSKPDERQAYTIVIPPPNITGVLHMGHMLNNTIQDLLIRKARLQGKNACWVPGTDHASIATEAKVVRMLREKGIKKSDLSREEFLKYSFEWKEKYGGIILQQLRKLGASCDWDRTAFTMDEARSKQVIRSFVDLYNKGKLYRGKRMINWDPDAKTVLSNEEVIYYEENAQLFYLFYKLEGSNEGITIATQRPETIMADVAVAVHPDDPRYQHMHGRKVIIPLINRTIPIVCDEYVDPEFGTGALKITPAHDQNDYEIGLKHKLPIIDILNEDGSLNSEAEILVGMDRFEARKKIKPLLEEAGLLVKVEPYRTNIGRSERTNSVVEPRLSLQWYVDMKSLSGPALNSVLDGEIEFLPDNLKNTYKHWLENIRDWCISRQLWWGHRVPAYYYQDEVFVAESIEEAFALAKSKFPDDQIAQQDLRQDEDVLDTWFSSWLWPFSVFEREEDLRYYYPTSVLVTGWDIIFLWVARMIMAGFEWQGTRPFEKVYFTGMVRDKLRRKMSKSLGNSPDALELIDKYGADGVRFGMLSSSPAGGDLLFDEKLCEQGSSFSNKIWNARILVGNWTGDPQLEPSKSDLLALNWIQNKFNFIVAETNRSFEQLKLSEILKILYSFIWDDFCGFYLEAIKPKKDQAISQKILNQTISIFERICTILHPFMPFITEETWHRLKPRKEGDDCMVSSYPSESSNDVGVIQIVEELRGVLTQISALRQKHSVKNAVAVPLYILEQEGFSNLSDVDGASELLQKLAHLQFVQTTKAEINEAQSFLGLRNKYFVILPVEMNVEDEKQKLQEQIGYTKGFISSVEKKLANEKFVQNAAPDVVEKERQKMSDGLTRLKALEDSLLKLN